ncbi:MAG TPA: NlpC/P60 family protein [Geobacteraceae bacterium]|nr:NlpC/P60 family protein [Geobacteraceae bacterium]
MRFPEQLIEAEAPPNEEFNADNSSDTSGLNAIVAETAKRFVGIPYQWGGNNVVSHVGIYVGDNKFVQAPRRNDKVKISDLDNPGFSKKYFGAKRYL